MLDEYAKISWKNERGRPDIIVAEMENRSEHELLIYMHFRKSETGTARRRHMSYILRHLTQFRKLDPKRITFLVSTEETTTTTKFQSVPADVADLYASAWFLKIPAEKFGQYEQLFRQ